MDFSPLFMSLVASEIRPTTGPVGLFDWSPLCITHSETPPSAGFFIALSIGVELGRPLL